MKFSNKDYITKAQRHILAAVSSLRGRTLTPEEHQELQEFISYVSRMLGQQVRTTKLGPELSKKGEQDVEERPVHHPQRR